ncbi:MAG TPA: response regulator [Cyclobacteriaceae bacterium]|nr:response regulator [Cyclobacteriaceae bacterium]
MNFFKNLSIRTKLIISALMPLCGLIFYLQINIQRESGYRNDARQVLQIVAEMEALGGYLNEIRNERALVESYLITQDAQDKKQLNEQFEKTDIAGDKYNSEYLTDDNRNAEYWIYSDSLPEIRSFLSDQSQEDEVGNYYKNFKTVMLNRCHTLGRGAKNYSIINLFEEYMLLKYAMDDLGSLRRQVGNAILNRELEDYGQFALTLGSFRQNLEKFNLVSSPDIRSFFDKKFQGKNIRQTQEILNRIIMNPAVPEMDYNQWRDISTASMDAISDTENYAIGMIRNIANREMIATGGRLQRNVVISAFILLFVTIVLTSTILNIVKSIKLIKLSADRMALGEVDFNLDITSKDEIASLADSFNLMISVTREYSKIAESIGRGDYSQEIRIRSKADILGNALDNMKNNLIKLSRENEIRTWLLTGSREMNDKLRGDKDIIVLANEAITQLVTYMNAQIGSIYIRENGQFNLRGSYAWDVRKGNKNSFQPGQGLIGQAAIEKKPILFTDVPEDYIRINSGLGNTIPKNIIVHPFLYEGEANGVAEIGSVKEFGELDMQFLNMVGENIAIAFNSAQSRTRQTELLEETQRQAEELEAQQEELKQSNEELQEKTMLLERSEAELKSQQEELQQSNEELEEKANLLEEQKERLENAKMDIETKARELEVTGKYKSEFLANMSHELRTPLNSILILAQLLAENKNSILTDKEVEYAKNIHSSGIDLLNLINEILDLSKVEAGKMDLEIKEIPFGEIQEDLLSIFSEVASSKKIVFDVNVSPKISGVTIATDKQRLEQILKNILSNAFKFTEKGGTVNLDISRVESGINRISDKLKVRSDIVSFSVTDSGMGIPREKVKIIFEAFQQADGSTKRKYGGTGLGLSISRELAGILGGEIHLESEEGKGSKFTLYLPLKFDFQATSPSGRKIELREGPAPMETEVKLMDATIGPEPEVNDDRNNIREGDRIILIVEDDANFAKLLLDFVRERKFKGIIAMQGNTGLSYARYYKPDAIILDLKLPVMGGTEILMRLKNDTDMRHIPVQIISVSDQRKETMESGAFDFLRKPASKDDMVKIFDKIEDFLNRKLKKLLIVEDDVKQNKAVRELIGNGDVKCSSAFSGSEALDLLAKNKFDCVIIDLGLPDMTGFELIEKIKSNDNINKIPIVVYTGKDLKADESRRLNRLANSIVLKTAGSKERLLDETTLFLHRVESKLPEEKQNIIRKLHRDDEILKNKKVLVVDDDIRNVYSITNALEEEGMECLTAENGREALKVMRNTHDIDIILMDIMMPEMDGFEATKAIRNSDKYPKIPVIALTAKAMKGDREKCLTAGMSDYIAKPVNIEQLLSLMRVWLYH